MKSLRQRLSRGLMTILCVIFVIHWFAADWVIRSVAEKQMASRLNDDGYNLLETMTTDDNGKLSFNADHISSVYKRPFSGHYFVVQVDGLATLSPSLQNTALALNPIGPNQAQLYHLPAGPEQQPLLVLGQAKVQFGHKIVVSVAEDLSAVDHDISTIRFAYLYLTLIILACAIALQRYDVKRALEPLAAVENELERITQGLQAHISTEVPSEIKPMVKELNRLLSLVIRRLQQSRTSIGNLAHALKPPLAMIFRVADHPSLESHPELRQQLQAQSDAIHRCIERELKRARIAGNQQVSSAFYPQQELTALVKVLSTIYAHKDLTFSTHAPENAVALDREDVLEILGNLLDNACKWAKHEIKVEIRLSDALIISVEDDGPGCDPANGANLIQRGLRLDESTPGHGLGLAIVADIADFYQGKIDIGQSQSLGGFLVRVSLALHTA